MQSLKGVEGDLLEGGTTFQSLGLEPRLTKALARARFAHPTLVQAKAIPIALQGKDILCRARTGSGKTAAYCLPIIQKILLDKEVDNGGVHGIRAMILVPTKELCQQVFEHLKQLCYYCSKEVTLAHLAGDQPLDTQRAALLSRPDILVTTPSRAVAHLHAKNMDLRESLQNLVIDEADLVLSFGYDDDINKLTGFLPPNCQTFLMSATLSADVEKLKHLVLKNAAVLKLQEADGDVSRLKQYCFKCSNDDKFLLIYFILKLKLFKGKCIIFVNNVDRGYRLKLFLEKFGIKSCVLNSEMPQNSRYHVVQEFNRGVYDYIIATDEGESDPEKEEEAEESAEAAEEDQEAAEGEEQENTEMEAEEGGKKDQKKDKKDKKKKDKKRKGKEKDLEFGVSRGVDFKNVEAVINFDFPRSALSYVHRIGRTARGGCSGTALSFVAPREMRTLEIIEKHLEKEIEPYLFNMTDVEGFRYRVSDALRAVTRSHVKEARLKEIKREILNSEKLKQHFEENPADFKALRHDKTVLQTKNHAYLRRIPGYLKPGHKKGSQSIGGGKTFAPFLSDKQKTKTGEQRKRTAPLGTKKQADPLKSFKFQRDGGKVQKAKDHPKGKGKGKAK